MDQRWCSQADREARPTATPFPWKQGPWGHDQCLAGSHCSPHPQEQGHPLPLLRTWLLGTVSVFGVSWRQENKENPSCQCDSDLENPEKGKSWLLASKRGRPPAGRHRGSLGFVSSCCRISAFLFSKSPGDQRLWASSESCHLMEGGKMPGALL